MAQIKVRNYLIDRYGVKFDQVLPGFLRLAAVLTSYEHLTPVYSQVAASSSVRAYASRLSSEWMAGPCQTHSAKKRPAKTLKRLQTQTRQPKRPTDIFLASWEWSALRYQALLRLGRKCQCCGATPATGAVLHVDHIKPRSKYPELALSLDNLQILCRTCNRGKSNTDETDFRLTDQTAALDRELKELYEETP